MFCKPQVKGRLLNAKLYIFMDSESHFKVFLANSLFKMDVILSLWQMLNLQIQNFFDFN